MASGYPQSNETSGFPWNYIKLVEGDDILSILEQQTERLKSFYHSISAEQWEYAYAPGKWTMKGALKHVIDTERVFAYRLLRFLRNDPTLLPGMDQDVFMASINFDQEDINSVLKEWEVVRQSTMLLLHNIDREGWDRSGVASGIKQTVRTIAYTIAGHELHHERIAKEKYLS